MIDAKELKAFIKYQEDEVGIDMSKSAYGFLPNAINCIDLEIILALTESLDLHSASFRDYRTNLNL